MCHTETMVGTGRVVHSLFSIINQFSFYRSYSIIYLSKAVTPETSFQGAENSGPHTMF